MVDQDNQSLVSPLLMSVAMTLIGVRITRLTLCVSAAVAVSYGAAWPLYFVTPIFTFMYAALPVWIGWKMSFQLLLRLAFSLLIGIGISEFLLSFPLVCLPFYAVLFFFIYYLDTPQAPPMATLFMTIAVTLVPLLSFSGTWVPHFVAFALLFNMGTGLCFAWLFHQILPDRLSSENAPVPSAKKPFIIVPEEQERMRLALVSTIVALTAITFFFALNLAQYSLAMLYICFMAGTPTKNASISVLKANALATCIGGIAAIITFNLLVAVPTYPFLVVLTSCVTLIFSIQIYSGKRFSAAYSSGFTTFLVLLGTSTGVDQSATANFYLRIGQVLFAGLFTLAALALIEHLTRPKRFRLINLLPWRKWRNEASLQK